MHNLRPRIRSRAGRRYWSPAVFAAATVGAGADRGSEREKASRVRHTAEGHRMTLWPVRLRSRGSVFRPSPSRRNSRNGRLTSSPVRAGSVRYAGLHQVPPGKDLDRMAALGRCRAEPHREPPCQRPSRTLRLPCLNGPPQLVLVSSRPSGSGFSFRWFSLRPHRRAN
jgi:hypothetical protein